MKKIVELSVTILLATTHTVPAHAMLARTVPTMRAAAFASQSIHQSNKLALPILKATPLSHRDTDKSYHKDRQYTDDTQNDRNAFGNNILKLGVLAGASLAAYNTDWFKKRVAHAYSKEDIALASVGTIAAVTGGMYLWNMYTFKDRMQGVPLLPALTHDTTDMLKYMALVRKEFRQQLNCRSFLAGGPVVNKAMINEYKQIVAAFEQILPIFLLDECAECDLSRTWDASYRKAYEDRVIRALIDKISTAESTVEYVGFGACEKFQDLVIISRVLSQKPGASLAIHLIDPQYTTVADCRLQLGLPNAIEANESDEIHFDAQAITFFRSQSSQFSHRSDAYIQDYMHAVYLHHNLANKQFINFLRKQFPSAQISLHVHKNTEAYYAHVNSSGRRYADVIAASDVVGLFHASWIEEYELLCETALKNNPHAYNLCLDKGHDHTAYLTSLSLAPTQYSRVDSQDTMQLVRTREDLPMGVATRVGHLLGRIFNTNP